MNLFNEVISIDPSFFVVFFYYAGFILMIVAAILGIGKLVISSRKRYSRNNHVLAHNVHNTKYH